MRVGEEVHVEEHVEEDAVKDAVKDVVREGENVLKIKKERKNAEHVVENK